MSGCEFEDQFYEAHDRIRELEAALRRALDELGGAHSGHWDSTMQRGTGCPVCIQERETKEQLRKVLDDKVRFRS